METPINDFLQRYVESGTIRAHMPGHKGAYPCDITEIKGADSLYDANGIIAQSERKTAAVFGAYRTLYSCSGSTLCIQTMLGILRERCGKRIAAVRNCHRAFPNAAALLDLDVKWIYPKYSDSYLSGEVNPEMIGELLDTSDIDVLYLTTPDYLGKLTRLDEIAELCHDRGVRLAVDNAHGAYLRFISEDGIPMHPLFHGVDIVCDSAHKTLPVLTGGAYLHIADRSLEPYDGFAKGMMSIFGSSSPSYPVMQSMDLVDPDKCSEYFIGMKECSDDVKKALSERYVIEDGECGKITINALRSGYNGNELADMLREKGIECEYSDRIHTVLMITGLSYAEIEMIGVRLAEIYDAHEPKKAGENEVFVPYPHERAMSLRDAFLSQSERIPVEQAEGRICAKTITLCPPGVALIVGGEIFSENDIFFLKNYGFFLADVVK